MSTLYGRTPASTYPELLKIDHSGGGIDSTLREVEDGVGVGTPLKLAQNKISFHNVQWPVSGNATGKILVVGQNANLLEWVTLNSDAVPEGLNKYFTNTRARNAISATGSINYDPVTGVISFNETPLTASNIENALGYTPLNRGGDIVNGDLTIAGNLIVTGDSTVINTSVTTIEDPIIDIGGVDGGAPIINDGKDRGIKFQWHNGSEAKNGFFGFENSTGSFVFIPDASITGEVASGVVGNLKVATPSDAAHATTKAYVDGKTGANTSAAGSDKQIQFNSGNVLSASAYLTWNNDIREFVIGSNAGLGGAIKSQDSSTANVKAGNLVITTGSNAISGPAGDLFISTGDAVGNGHVGANISIKPGSSVNTTGGSLLLSGGMSTSGSAGHISFSTNNIERLRILATGAWSIGSSGSATGTTTQVLTSNGAASSPTWTTMNTNYVTEGTNKYYTDSRVRAAISVSGALSYNATTGVISYTTPNTDGIAEGANLYFTTARARNAISTTGSLSYNASTGVISYITPSTDGVIEGSTNHYFTTSRARSSISVTGNLTYDSMTGVIGYVAPTSGAGSGDFKADGSVSMTGEIKVPSIVLSNISRIESATVLSSSTVMLDVLVMDKTQFSTAKLVVTVKSGTSVYASEFLLMHNDTDVFMTEYGIISTSGSLGTFDAYIDTDTVNFAFTPSSANALVVKASALYQ